MNELALFAGAGGGILGGHLLGWRTVCAVEWEPYPASVLCARQNDGILPPFPIWDDVQTFDGKPWRGRVDVVSGGFPCQDISAAGKGTGIDGKRSGMWGHMARIVREVEPRFVFVENSPILTSRGLGRVLGDLAAMGYDAQWGMLGAHHAGAPHKRDRIWIVAHTNHARQFASDRPGSGLPSARRASVKPPGGGQAMADSEVTRLERLGDCSTVTVERSRQGYTWPERSPNGASWRTEPDVGRVAHGVAARVDRLKAIGNGQVAAVAALAWQILSKDFTQYPKHTQETPNLGALNG
jgi:DNA (cytosine-5)-methyltransferase 1